MNDDLASPVDAPDRLRSLPTWMLARAHLHAHTLLHEMFRAHDLRGYHYRVLVALEEGGPSSQIVICRQTGIDRSDMVATLTDLDARGFVTRTVDRQDRRRNVVGLTDVGRAQLVVLDRAVQEVQDILLAPLAADERRAFLDALRRLDIPTDSTT